MTATVSLTPDELNALDRHHQGTSIPADQTTLGRILTKVRAGAHWQALTVAPPVPHVGRWRRTTTGCDYCAHNCTYPPHADHCTCECQCNQAAA